MSCARKHKMQAVLSMMPVPACQRMTEEDSAQRCITAEGTAEQPCSQHTTDKQQYEERLPAIVISGAPYKPAAE